MRHNRNCLKIFLCIWGIASLISLPGCANKSDYKNALIEMDRGNYAEAIQLLDSLGDYEDAPQKLSEAYCLYADLLMEAGEYDAAYSCYKQVNGADKELAEKKMHSIDCIPIADSITNELEQNFHEGWESLYLSFFGMDIEEEVEYRVNEYTYYYRMHLPSLYDAAYTFGELLGVADDNVGSEPNDMLRKIYKMFYDKGFQDIMCVTEVYRKDGSMLFSTPYSYEDYLTDMENGVDISSNTDSNNAESTEPSSTFDTPGETPKGSYIDFAGEWGDSHSQRCFMDVEELGNDCYAVEIHWSSSASEDSQWNMTAQYNSLTGEFEYHDGKEISCIYAENGDYSETIVYSDGTGAFFFTDGYMHWRDDIEHTGDRCAFERYGQSQTEESTNYLTNGELADITDYFNEVEHNGLLRFPYNSISDPNFIRYLSCLFYDITDGSANITDSEWKALEDMEMWMEGDIRKLSTDYILDYLSENFGQDRNWINEKFSHGLDQLGLYLPEYDAYYDSRYDTDIRFYTFDDGVHLDDGVIRLYYTANIYVDEGEDELTTLWDQTMYTDIKWNGNNGWYVICNCFA